MAVRRQIRKETVPAGRPERKGLRRPGETAPPRSSDGDPGSGPVAPGAHYDQELTRRAAWLRDQRRGLPPVDRDDPALSQPPVTLYATRGEESQRAFALLEQAGIRFRVVPAPRRRHPSVEWGDGVQATGLEGIADLVARLDEMKGATFDELARTMPYLLEQPDAALKTFMEEVRARQLEEARTVMASLQ
jgi:hypothetical protein